MEQAAARIPSVGSIPLSAYVHWPWCLRKCPYCDFNSRACRGAIPEREYLEAVLADLARQRELAAGRPLVSVYIGGGTPSLISADGMHFLLDGVRALFALAPGCEISMEANPGTRPQARFSAYAEAGVNRLSLGVQSFADPLLRAIGRVHSASEAMASAECAAKVFSTFNLDLMFGLPGQTLEMLGQDLERALSLGCPHLSCYQLTLEEGTAFARKPPEGLPGEDELGDMSELAVGKLRAGGLLRYEVSGYARPGHECRHNLNYWQYGDYLAAGAGAHGKVSTPRGILRFSHGKSPGSYMASVFRGDAFAHSRWVGDRERPFEFMLDGLRLLRGVRAEDFEARTGLSFDGLLPRIEQARDMGLVTLAGGRLAATEKGMDFLSDLQELFLD